MANDLPQFEAPPVTETVISVQFSPIPNYSSALIGWFWKSVLDTGNGGWSKAVETLPIPDQFEGFGPDGGWAPPGFTLTQTDKSRVQIIRSDEERMIQTQFTRFILNWKKGQGPYPSYSVLLPEFEELFEKFCVFMRQAGCGPLALNQWEVTYVNMIERGGLWREIRDISRILRGIHIPEAVPPVHHIDTAALSWRYVIGNEDGRVHVGLSHVRLGPENREALRLQIVARGELNSPGKEALRNGLNLGHEAIVRTFAAITTPEAHTTWKKIR